VAEQCAQKTAYASKRIAEVPGFSIRHTAPRFNEFVVSGPVPAKELLSRLAQEQNITGGLALSRYFKDRPNDFLVCVTELNSKAQIDDLVEGLASVVKES
jgi:glycine dehydrogenase subunit 1